MKIPVVAVCLQAKMTSIIYKEITSEDQKLMTQIICEYSPGGLLIHGPMHGAE